MKSPNSAGPYRWISPLRNARGVTLVELIILLVVASIAIPGLMVLFIEGVENSALAQLDTVSAGLAQELMEEIKAKRWNEDCCAALLGAEVGESRCNPTIIGCAPFDDVDDYDGLNNNPPEDPHGTAMPGFAAYTQQVSVCYVAEIAPVSGGGAGADAGACGVSTTPYKKITVTITWGAGNQVTFESVAADYDLS